MKIYLVVSEKSCNFALGIVCALLLAAFWMKKLLFTLLALMAFVPLWAQEDTLLVQGYHPYDTLQNTHVARRNANWSIIPHIGFNVFDGDFNSEMKHPVSYPSAGLDIEYDFTPVFGLGVEYMYGRYGARGNAGHADTLLYGNLHRASGYISIDLVGLFYPHGKRKIVGIDAMFGGGYTWYQTWAMYHDDRNSNASPVRNPTHVKGGTLAYVNADGLIGRPDYMTKFEGTPFLQFGLNVEFNLNRTLALGVRANYNYFLSDALDGRGYAGDAGVASKNNDGLLDVTLNMRIKLIGKDHSHVRNMGGGEPDPVIAKNIVNPEPVHVHDTVIIYHDTIIEIRDNTLPATHAVAEVAQAPARSSSSYYIYFPTGKAEINNQGLATIQQVADRMREDASLYAVITGYCDNTGSDKVNYLLGDKRAANVLEELQEEYNIPSDHLFAGGVGKLVGGRSTAAYGPNRRAAIQLVNEETFRILSAELDNLRSKREMELQAKNKKAIEPEESKDEVVVIEVRSARPESVETSSSEEQSPYALRHGVEATVSKNSSLAQLARQYYDNTHCWVYIYLANKQIINPNKLTPDWVLHIPELTEEELSITKEDASQLSVGGSR